ncbi:hypothetical protein NB724_004040 [Pantoea ananatis]|nr:hypothetical protein [Pantoea ananatis]MCW0318889.1 hypothetical protein [Pantoea ananatis]MCW0337057.1 hypothetical protein [Pantoea ananatis]MCW0385167.1 hypothetical protein [Pantoea ananatis]MCW0409846.1 hypothetical protein [Pantoea ananatis]
MKFFGSWRATFLAMLSDAPRPVKMPCYLNRERLDVYQKWYLNRTRAP